VNIKKRNVLAALPVVALVLLFTMGAMSQRKPKSLGAVAGQLAACTSKPNCVSSQAKDNTQRVAPLAFADSPELAWDRLRAAVSSMGMAKIVTNENGYMHVEFRSRFFRFVDDLELLLDAANHKIDIRSASRLGYSDFGVNRARVERLRIVFSDMATTAVQ
jgi:uncharacterized protein (DUF1499 family)